MNVVCIPRQVFSAQYYKKSIAISLNSLWTFITMENYRYSFKLQMGAVIRTDMEKCYEIQFTS